MNQKRELLIILGLALVLVTFPAGCTPQNIFETKSQEEYSPIPMNINFSGRLGIPNNHEV